LSSRASLFWHHWGRRPGRSEEGRRPERSEGCLGLRSTGQGRGCRPDPFFFVTPICHPERSEGSLGTCVPREDTVGNVAPSFSFFVAPSCQAEGAPWGRRPERSEGCLGLRSTGQGRGAGQGEEISCYARNDKMSSRGLAIAKHDKGKKYYREQIEEAPPIQHQNSLNDLKQN
jgi:hypothetical protein